MKKRSISDAQVLPKIVLVGNPNVGKSVLFNALTGAYTTVSNYPGTSVEVSRGVCEVAGQRFEVLDTPGMYTLMPITEEERVARAILLEETPHTVLHVIDARNIERMLPMTLQLVEAGLPVVLVVNIMDEAERLGMEIDTALLEEKIGIPVIAAATARKRGLQEIRAVIENAADRPQARFSYAADLESDIRQVADLLREEYRLSRKSLALLLLQRDTEIEALVRRTEGEQDYARIAQVVNGVVFERRADLHLRISLERKRVCSGLLAGVVRQSAVAGVPLAERLSNWMMNPWTGVPILLLILYFGLYQVVGVFGAGVVVDFLEGVLFEEHINPWVERLGQTYLAWDWLYELLVGEYGVLTLGVRYAVALVLPIVGSFFLVFSLIEDTGYFPRLAMLVDRVFKRIGLNGRAVIPIVLGFGCDTMATIVTRTLETIRERIIATLLLALAIPCSAQLGVILGLLSGVPGALVVWSACIAGLFLLVGFLAARVMPGEQPMFYMEIPPLRMPQPRNVLVKTLTRMQSYFLEIFPLFILASVLLWAGKMTGLLEGLVRAMTPAMNALGLPAEAAAAFIFGFFRRDFGAAGLYDLQTSGLLSAVQLTVAAVTLTLFVPCIAQFLIMQKERGWRVSLGILVFVSVLAFTAGALLNRLLLAGGVLS
ncbi:ferrous iron transport protein B [Geoalkalibacter halelectricus]|uniref:Ferrous iron transport protein B n=1 Tax=Geoalkalibacter halelectricus TaxID=2847045 RepID=A0ABY5ZLG1_9BACT|nr:ferrous iron transport protein B [Geoalkalibacter halelectricus]MDO3379610.1 ferrous iron transport protein B [Geoalkalibacter halelectricus]UWZ78574.1 ferrous iron transport protein B [Geoalkalibacter halelectricus]